MMFFRNLSFGKFFLIGFLALFVYAGTLSSPRDFPVGYIIVLEEGLTLRETADVLEKKNVVRYAELFEIIVRVLPGEHFVHFGEYVFGKRVDTLGIIHRILTGKFGLTLTRVTVPEGLTVKEIAALFEKKFPSFDGSEFIRIAEKDDGYLFPETYFFLPNVRAKQVHETMRMMFDERISAVVDEIAQSEHSLHDIITMASLLEEEARQTETRKLISGILWDRLEIGMPLQVDATFLYINGKNTFELTLEDLRENESPYNTYKYGGLPPGPITNPSMDAILAALRPTKSPYLFYLADMEGNTHYSVTFDEHKRKKQIYLQ